jgi:simple sugar transport system permease protein
MSEYSFIIGLFDTTVAVSTILLIASLGEIITERSGVVNLGIEGLLSVSAFLSFVTLIITSSGYTAILVGATSGGLFAAMFAIICVSLKADQVVAGLMFSILGLGLTSFFTGGWGGEGIEPIPDITIPVIGTIPVAGPILFQNTITEYLIILLVPAVWYLLFRTRVGLSILAVGDDPETANSQGIDVARTRYFATILGGVLMGTAGAHISVSYTGLWTQGLVGGRGWIVIALVIFARWNPLGALIGSVLFGFVESLAVRFQGIAVTDHISLTPPIDGVLVALTDSNILQTYPYIITIISLVIISVYSYRSSAAPNALMKQYYH